MDAAVERVDRPRAVVLRLEDAAQRLVIEGFLAELVERFEEGPLRDELAGTLERRLALVLG